MFKESAACKIELHDDPPEVVDRMLRYFYNFDYEAKEDYSSYMTRYTAPIHVQMYCIADKYEVPGLRMLALEKFKSVTSVLCQQWYVLAQATHAVNEAQLPESDTSLRDILVDAWLLSGCAPLAVKYFPTTFTKLMSDAPWLSFALHSRTLGSLVYIPKQATCAVCKTATSFTRYDRPLKCKQCNNDLPVTEVTMMLSEVISSRGRTLDQRAVPNVESGWFVYL